MMRITFLFLIFIAFSHSAAAQKGKDAFRSTPYPLPRFVSIRSKEAYARTGPGKQYPIRYVYKRKGLPVEIILEFESWRKIRDQGGDEGWVHQTLLSGKRTAILKQQTTLLKKPKPDAKQAAIAEQGAQVTIKQCGATYCQIRASGYEGWLARDNLWGLYPNEIID